MNLITDFILPLLLLLFLLHSATATVAAHNQFHRKFSKCCGFSRKAHLQMDCVQNKNEHKKQQQQQQQYKTEQFHDFTRTANKYTSHKNMYSVFIEHMICLVDKVGAHVLLKKELENDKPFLCHFDRMSMKIRQAIGSESTIQFVSTNLLLGSPLA